jgi:hypothetical protein
MISFLSLKIYLATLWRIFCFLWYWVLEQFCKCLWTNFGQFLLTANLATTNQHLNYWNNGVNKLHKNCPIEVQRLFITLTRSLKNSMTQKTKEFLKNSEKHVFSLLFFKVNKQMACLESIFSISSLIRANSP